MEAKNTHSAVADEAHQLHDSRDMRGMKRVKQKTHPLKRLC